MENQTKVVAFDAFGTLARIGNPQHPYRWLLDHAEPARRSEAPRRVMSQDMGLEDFGRSLCCSTELIGRAQRLLQLELSSIALFEDVVPTLLDLRAKGVLIAVVSNLAAPYGAPLKQLLGGLVDKWCLSYEVGAIKPDPTIFRALLQQTNSLASEVLMIGDRWESDVLGAQQLGIHALLLDRGDKQSASSRCLRRLTDLKALLDAPDVQE